MLQEDVMRLLKGLFSLIPLSFVIQYIGNKTLRYGYSLIIGQVMQFWVYGFQMYPLILVHSVLVYLVIKYKKTNLGGLITFESMAFLSCYNIYQFIYHYGGYSMNAAALLMILVCKYSLIAYNIDDGKKPESQLLKQQIKYRITHQITFLDYMGYINFLPTCLLGPPIQYKYYKDFMQRDDVYAHLSSVLKPMFTVLGETLLFGCIYMIGEIYAPLSSLRNMQLYQNSSSLYVFCYSTLVLYLCRGKYFFAWKLSMVSIHASGVSFDGKHFNRINTVNPMVFQTTMHVRDKINNWNISVQQWLRKSIYNRSPFKNKTAQQLYVFVISAFWHGFYEGYYISFALWFAQLHLQGLIFKYCKSGKSFLARMYAKSGKVGHFILTVIVMLQFNHIAVYFLMLQSTFTWTMMKKLYFLPQILLFVLIAIFTVIRPPKQGKQDKKVIQKSQINEVKHD